MSNEPTKKSIASAIKEYEKIGRDAFLKKYTSGYGPKSYYIIHHDKQYPLKAIWSAAHTPYKHTLEFNTRTAAREVRRLGYDYVSNSRSFAEFVEGKRFSRETNYFVRESKLVKAAKKEYGTKCMVCGFDFAKVYGELGLGFIECHHLAPLSSNIERNTKVEDVAVLCANCHRMIHRRKTVLTVDELKKIMCNHKIQQSKKSLRKIKTR